MKNDTEQRLESIRNDIEDIDAIDRRLVSKCGQEDIDHLRRRLVQDYFRVRCDLDTLSCDR